MISFSYPSPRVSQLDADILDSELVSLLKQQLSSISHLHRGWWTYESQPELWSLLLNLVVFRLTVWKKGTSYGLGLQNLQLSNFKNGKIIGYSKRTALLAVIIGDYLFTKFQSYLYSVDEADVADAEKSSFALFGTVKRLILTNRTKILTSVSSSLRVLNLVNFTLFLISGRYSTLIHRVLGISLTPVVSDLLKFNGSNVNFEFQNRQLVWNTMTEFLVFILPLLQLKKLRRMSSKMLLPYRKKAKKSQDEETFSSAYSNLPISQCAICHNNSEKRARSLGKTPSSLSSFPITNPHVTNCGHIYCYICIATKFNAIENNDGDEEGCLRCGLKLTWFEEYGSKAGDVDEDAIMVMYEEEEPDMSEKLSAINESSPEASDDSSEDEDSSQCSEGEDFGADEAFEL
ncbi:hypothetical protein PGUG_05098 [Meyerozyma guilliermondii ATCC 6260]|uniref:RING-type domain-containing protein n=1 Tax=Meyerozyma guilliermondii (strain ATCC 6260 / CBS 566 / DSM 6381 / JCM 1539 / NBRC 10279 / NRRL Y-324) TaxID=294746 RepID=A5DP97_PICGU|nr:uncharacterized protein PGUG_05098 [Meyerozyma guilliermondii ATCC 6260]EDK41000.2 hypothetical protein PGUG_05098 [Meyerozyma guilliermondii ATCC 6260]